MASQLGVVRETVYEWERVHPEFSDALTRARQNCQAWWEDQGQTGMVTPGFNAAVWTKNVSARFKDDWGDSKKVELAGSIELSTKEQRDAAVAAAARADA